MDGIEIIKYSCEGFRAVMEFERWKVGIFNSAPRWQEDQITYVQKHNKSDEAFVLLKGHCTLYISTEETPTRLPAFPMRERNSCLCSAIRVGRKSSSVWNRL